MHVQVKLFATLSRHRPDVAAGTPFEVELPAGATITGLLSALGPARGRGQVGVRAGPRPQHRLAPPPWR